MKLQPVDVTTKSVEELKQFWVAKVPMIGITHLLTHEDEHFDEVVTQIIFKLYGKYIFPECMNIPIGFSNNEEMRNLLGSEEKDAFWILLQRGHLCFGMAGGPLDDHEKENSEECAATLLAKYLEVDKKPELARLLTYTLFSDKYGDQWKSQEKLSEKDKETRNALQEFLPSKVMKNMWDVAKEKNWSTEKIGEMIKSVSNIIEIDIEYQKLFHEIKSSLNEDKLKEINLNKYNVAVVVESPYRMAGKVARSIVSERLEPGRVIALTVTLNSKNNMFNCMKRQNGGPDLQQMSYILRKTVAEKRGLKLDKKTLSSTGEVPGIPIFLHPKLGNLFNGSNSHPTTDGLFKKDLSKRAIVEAIHYGVAKRYHFDHKENCLKGICAGEKCPLFSLGLTQCQKVKNSG